MDSIQSRGFENPELQRVEAAAMKVARENTNEILRDYSARPDTFGGRYVAADTMKELMPGYAQSPDARSRLNGAVHNSAAVLSAEQFRRILERGSSSDSNTAVFITGIPGAGKSSSVAMVVGNHAAVVFEGQLSRPAPAFEKIDQALKAGFDVQILVVHVPPEVALERTNSRFMDPQNGRGASISVMSDIQSNLPAGLEQIHKRYGDSVRLAVMDNTPTAERFIEGWAALSQLQKEGSRDQISERLHKALDTGYREGRYSDDFYKQAAGRSPSAQLGADRGASADRGLDQDAGRSKVSGTDQKSQPLTPYSAGKQSVLDATQPTTAALKSTGPQAAKPAPAPQATPEPKPDRSR